MASRTVNWRVVGVVPVQGILSRGTHMSVSFEVDDPESLEPRTLNVMVGADATEAEVASTIHERIRLYEHELREERRLQARQAQLAGLSGDLAVGG